MRRKVRLSYPHPLTKDEVRVLTIVWPHESSVRDEHNVNLARVPDEVRTRLQPGEGQCNSVRALHFGLSAGVA